MKINGHAKGNAEVASDIFRLIGKKVSVSSISKARSFFGTDGEELTKNIVEYYLSNGKWPRSRDDERSHKRMPTAEDKVRPAIEEKVRKSVAAMRDKLAFIMIGANSALELTAPDENGDYANLGNCYRGLSLAISAIREAVGPSLAARK